MSLRWHMSYEYYQLWCFVCCYNDIFHLKRQFASHRRIIWIQCIWFWSWLHYSNEFKFLVCVICYCEILWLSLIVRILRNNNSLGIWSANVPSCLIFLRLWKWNIFFDVIDWFLLKVKSWDRQKQPLRFSEISVLLIWYPVNHLFQKAFHVCTEQILVFKKGQNWY